MPLIPKSQVAPHQLHGVMKVDTNISFRERLKKRFRPTDTVQVWNPTNAEIQWQWLDENDESYTIEDDTNIKIVSREQPGLWRLGPGEEDILLGSCAYLMVEALFKQMCVMKTGIVLHPLDEREIRNFSFDDPEQQELVIDKIFKGKMTPQSMQLAAVSKFGGGAPRIEDEFEPLATEQSEYQRRQASERRIVTKPRTIDTSDEPLGGRATGGLPMDRQVSPENSSIPEVPPAADPPEPKKAEKKKEPAAV